MLRDPPLPATPAARFRLRLVFVVVAGTAAFFLLVPASRRGPGPSVPPRPLPAFLETGLVEHFDRMPEAPLWGGEAAAPDRLRIVNEPVRLGPGALGFTLHPGDMAAKRNRAEIKLFDCGPVGRELWYAWSFLVPADYADTADPTLFQIMGQWHDLPDPRKGESFDGYPAHPPMVAVYYGVRVGTPGFAIAYGLEGRQRELARTFIEKGRWIDLLFHIRWSRGADGFAEAWMDGRPLTSPERAEARLSGPNMYNDVPAFLKLGLYREAGFTTTNRVYFDELRIGPTRESVAIGR